MSGIVNFLKSLIGINGDDEGFIGLSSFNSNQKELHDTKVKKEYKKELTLSEMLRRT